MLSFPHLVVLFIIALIIFGPQKLPELARMLGKATAEFRKMTNDFRYALEDEVRELERQTRIREEEIAAAARAAQSPVPPAPATTNAAAEASTALSLSNAAAPEGSVPREAPNKIASSSVEPLYDPSSHLPGESAPSEPPAAPVSISHEKSSDDNPTV